MRAELGLHFSGRARSKHLDLAERRCVAVLAVMQLDRAEDRDEFRLRASTAPVEQRYPAVEGSPDAADERFPATRSYSGRRSAQTCRSSATRSSSTANDGATMTATQVPSVHAGEHSSAFLSPARGVLLMPRSGSNYSGGTSRLRASLTRRS